MKAWDVMCELNLEEGIALDCQVENCRVGFSGRQTTRGRSLSWGKLLASALKEIVVLGNAEILGTQVDGWSNQKMASEKKHRL